MSWNYSGNPALNPRDSVRFRIGDTTPGQPVTLSDEEIDYLIATEGAEVAAEEAALALAARYSGIAATSKKIGDLQISYEYGQLAERFTAMAARFRKGRRSAFTPIISSETETAGVFSIGMDDYAE